MSSRTARESSSSGSGREISRSLVTFAAWISLARRPFGNSIFPALRASTFFAKTAANSTHASVRPIVFMLGPVYHHPDVLIDTDSPFSRGRPFTFYLFLNCRAGLHVRGIRAVQARTSNRMIRYNEQPAARTRKGIGRSLRADLLRSSFFRTPLSSVPILTDTSEEPAEAHLRNHRTFHPKFHALVPLY